MDSVDHADISKRDIGLWVKILHITTIRRLLSNQKLDNKQTNTVPTLENFPFCPADAAIVANIPLADISMIY
jgi:hypothetical protein